MPRLHPWILVVFLACSIPLYLATPAPGATPSSGTVSPSTSTASWSGGPVTGTSTDPLAADCTNTPCDLFTLIVTGTDPSIHTVTVRIDWLSPTNDLDLHVIDAATGAVVQTSGEAVSNFEQLNFTANPGTYTVQTLFYRSVGESYTGNATLVTGPAPEPPNQFRTATYQNFDFQFTPEVQLPEQRRSLVFIDQDIEPEIEVDRFGTIYIGAIRGIPGGVDFWRSDNGGASFQYLGQPDGTQNPTPNPPSPEGGVGGGDVDIAMGDPFTIVPESPAGPAIKSTGRIYCTSLWLGSATLSVSLDRGENWVPNPFTTAQLDRQWNLARGEKTLYMSLRKLGQLVLGQNDVYVAQSDDGLNFTKGSFVQDPLGENVPDDVGGNSVLTSDGRLYGTFVSEDGKDLYLWRTRTAPADLPPGPLDVPAFAPNSFDVGLIFHGVGSLTTNNTFPIMAVDKADNLHIAFGDRTNIYLISCAAGSDPTVGSNWTLPVPLNAPKLAGFEYTRTTMFPWIRGGEAGRVAAIWYGTDVMGDPDTPVFETNQVPWKLVYAQVEDAFAESPRVYLQVASQQGGGVVHTGQICVRGTGCPDGTRELAEYSSVTVDNEGFANIAYAGTIIAGTNPTDAGAITFFTKSRARPLVTPPVTTELDCHDPRISRKGGWHEIHDGRATNGSYCRNVGSKKGGSSGAFLEFQYNGNELDVQIARGPRGGNAEMIIDGVSRGKVDFFRPHSDPTNPDQTGRRDLTFGEFVTLETPAGNHTFRLEVLNDSPLSDRDMVYVDGFVVRGGEAQGEGNPTESSTMVEGTVAPSPLPLTGAAHPVAALASTMLLTGVLEMEDGANLDLALLDPSGAVMSLGETASMVETARRAPFGAGGYSFVVMNRGTAPASYRLHMVTTTLSGPPTVTAVTVSAEGHPASHGTVEPFGPQASLSFVATKPGRVTVRVFDLSGKVVRTFAKHKSVAGRNIVRWDGRFDSGDRVASGVYFYRVQHADGSVSKHKTAILR
jgi:flagellar hook capping protein FlgD